MKESDDLKVAFYGYSLVDSMKSLGVLFRNSRRDESIDVLASVGIMDRVGAAHENKRRYDDIRQYFVNGRLQNPELL